MRNRACFSLGNVVEGLNTCVVEFSGGGDESLSGSVNQLADQREVALGAQHAPQVGERLSAVGERGPDAVGAGQEPEGRAASEVPQVEAGLVEGGGGGHERRWLRAA